MRNRKHKYALITGASSGIGEEFARQLAARGFYPILVARRKERLMEIAEEIEQNYHVTCTVFSADLSQASECKRLLSYVEDLPLGIVINNAGFGDCGLFLETDLDKELSMIDVNIRAMHLLSKGVLHKFKKQGGGYLLNVASSAGLLPAGPYMATYYASKAYVASLTQAISREFKESKSPIYIGALCPGPVDTEFNDQANVIFALPGISAEECVEEAISGMLKKKTVIVPSLRMKLAVNFSPYLPKSILIAITGHQQKKKLNNK